MDGVVHPNVEQAIGRDRIRKALKRYENRPADEHRYGIVRAVNEDGSYEVLLDGDVQTSRCAQYGTALVGDRVLAVTKKDGRNDLIGRLGGEIGGGGTVVTKVDDVSNYIAGRVFAHAGTNDPAGALPCDGRAVSRREYWELFDAIGTTYGSGDGSSTFNLPNVESRTIIGESDSYALGATGGEEKHQLTIEEMPRHGHPEPRTVWNAASGQIDGYVMIGDYTQTTTQSIGLQGGDQPHNNMQPYIVMRYFITTGKGDPVSGINPADYVVEWGNTDGWRWEKWASGKAECWYSYKQNHSAANGTAFNFNYYSVSNITFPFEFADVPSIQVTGNVGSQNSFVAYVKEPTTTSVNVEICTNTSGAQAVRVYVHLLGKWKDSPASSGTETIAPTIAERFEKLEPVVLYDNASGTTGTVTLSESAENFSYLEIFAKTNDGDNYSVRVCSPNGKTASMIGGRAGTNGATFFKTKLVSISGKSITVSRTSYLYIDAGYDTCYAENSDGTYIVRVNGYK